jgi:hypothetical protein
MSPAYYDSIQEGKCIPSFLSVPMDEKQCVQDVADPLSADATPKLTARPVIESHHHSLDHGESLPSLDHGESPPTLDHGESPPTLDHGESLHPNDQAFLVPPQEDGQPTHANVIPAVNDHDKDLDNDGEITTKLLSTIATDDPNTDVPINSVYYGVALLHGLCAPPSYITRLQADGE